MSALTTSHYPYLEPFVTPNSRTRRPTVSTKEPARKSPDDFATTSGQGETVRRLIDCLIAAAIEARIPILHADIDLDVLARHTPLQLVIP